MRRGPVLCLIDDAHWLDHASATTLLFVARRLQAERVAVVFAARDDTPVNGPDFCGVGLPELRLGGLGSEAAAALLEQRAGAALSRGVIDRLVERTAGNPLALLELDRVSPT